MREGFGIGVLMLMLCNNAYPRFLLYLLLSLREKKKSIRHVYMLVCCPFLLLLFEAEG